MTVEVDVLCARMGTRFKFDSVTGFQRAELKGWMCSSGLTISDDCGQDSHGFAFAARSDKGSGSKTLDLICPTAEEREEWVAAFRSISNVEHSQGLEINDKRVVRVCIHNHVHFLRFESPQKRNKWLHECRSAVKKAWIARDLELHPNKARAP